MDIQHYGNADSGYTADEQIDERQQALAELAIMKRRSTEAGVVLAERVARATEALISLPFPSQDAEREAMDTVFRSLDVMALLVSDAGRRRQGYPPAALHEAVHMLLEQMDRITPKVRAH